MNMRSLKKLIGVFTFVMFIGTLTSYAQPGDDPPGNPPVPISGIGYLLALGGAMGIKKLYDKKKRNNLK